MNSPSLSPGEAPTGSTLGREKVPSLLYRSLFYGPASYEALWFLPPFVPALPSLSYLSLLPKVHAAAFRGTAFQEGCL